MDENNDKRPHAALINKEWFEAAAEQLTTEQLGRLLVNAVGYVFTGAICGDMDEREAMAFAFARRSLDSDIAAYRERCARNAENARRKVQRVAPSGTQSQRVGSNPNTTPISTPTPTPTPISLQENKSTTKREKWVIYGYFWYSGSQSAYEECAAFWNYYESLGWKNNKGADIVNKLSAARMWRRQFGTKEAPAGASCWREVVENYPENPWGLYDSYKGFERKGDVVGIRLQCTQAEYDQVLTRSPGFEQRLLKAFGVPEIRIDCLCR